MVGSIDVTVVRAGAFSHKVGLQESVQVAVHDRIHVRRFVACADILDHFVRLHNVRADLRTPLNLLFTCFNLVACLVPFGNLHFVQLRLEQLHGLLLVAQLGTGLGVIDDDACGRVAQANAALVEARSLADLEASAADTRATREQSRKLTARLSAKRTYLDGETLDPRLLVFEAVVLQDRGGLLRPRQVEIV